MSGTIPLGHIVNYVRSFSEPSAVYAFIVVAIGAVHPIVTGGWKKSLTGLVFSFFRIPGLAFCVIVLIGSGPE